MFKNTLNFYTQFTDSFGHKHYAIHCYNRTSGFVTMMKDFKFQNNTNKSELTINQSK